MYQPVTTEVPEGMEVIPGTLIVEKASAASLASSSRPQSKPKGGFQRVFKQKNEIQGSTVQITKIEKPQRPMSAAVGGVSAIRKLGQAKSR
jgi:hypothetical protein